MCKLLCFTSFFSHFMACLQTNLILTAVGEFGCRFLCFDVIKLGNVCMGNAEFCFVVCAERKIIVGLLCYEIFFRINFCSFDLEWAFFSNFPLFLWASVGSHLSRSECYLLWKCNSVFALSHSVFGAMMLVVSSFSANTCFKVFVKICFTFLFLS